MLGTMANSGNSLLLSLPSLTHLTLGLKKTSSKEIFPRDAFSLFHTQIHGNSASRGRMAADPREKLPRWTAEAVAAVSLMAGTTSLSFLY